MSNAPGEAASSGEQVPPHVSGARMDADMASLFAEGGLELGPLPSSLLMVAQTTGGATEFCIQTVPHEARDARVRACSSATSATGGVASSEQSTTWFTTTTATWCLHHRARAPHISRRTHQARDAMAMRARGRAGAPSP